jgi:DNA-binding MarR family transcriptional regulator
MEKQLDAVEADTELDFDFLPQHFIHQFRNVSLDLSRVHAKMFKDTPMERGVGKITTLMLVARNPGLTQATIAKATAKDAPAMARLIEELVKEGLITRVVSPVERRAHALTITDRGKTELEKYKEITKACEREFTKVLTDEEREQAIAILRKLRRFHTPQAKDIGD